MKKTALVLLISLLSLCFSGARPALATPVTGLLDATSSNAWVINFESQTTGLPEIWKIGDAPFRATDNNFTIDSQFAEQYINIGQPVHSDTCEVGHFPILKISLTKENDASGATWGASDYPGEIWAYNSENNLLDTCNLPVTNASNSGNFVAAAFTTKDYVYLMAASDNYDWMFTVMKLYGCNVDSGAYRRSC